MDRGPYVRFMFYFWRHLIYQFCDSSWLALVNAYFPNINGLRTKLPLTAVKGFVRCELESSLFGECTFRRRRNLNVKKVHRLFRKRHHKCFCFPWARPHDYASYFKRSLTHFWLDRCSLFGALFSVLAETTARDIFSTLPDRVCVTWSVLQINRIYLQSRWRSNYSRPSSMTADRAKLRSISRFHCHILSLSAFYPCRVYSRKLEVTHMHVHKTWLRFSSSPSSAFDHDVSWRKVLKEGQ